MERSLSDVEMLLRDYQRRDVERILRAFERHRVVGFSAPTGYGKTLVALFVARKLIEDVGGDALIVVRTRNEITPFVRDSYRFFNSLPVVFLNKCRTCLRYRFEEEDLPIADCDDCSYSQLGERATSKGLAIVRNLCSKGRFDPYFTARALEENGICPYAFWRSLGSRIVVATYPWLRMIPPQEFEFRTLIVDEAHNIESVATSCERSIDSEVLRRAVESAISLGIMHRDVIKELVAAIASDVKGMGSDEDCKPFEKTKLFELVSDPFFAVSINRAIAEIVSMLLERARSGSGIRAPPCLRLALFARDAMEYARWIGIENAVLVRSGDNVEVRSVDFSVVSKLIEGFDRVLLMSGTLPSRRYMESVWSLRDIEIVKGSVSIVGRIEVVIETSATTRFEERSEAMWSRYAEIIECVAKMVRGLVLAMAPSYEIAKAIADRINGLRLFVEGRGTTIGSVERAARNRDVDVILAVANGKLVEGVELVEDGKSLVRAVVVCGVPYPKKTRYLDAVLQKLKEKGVNPWMWLNEKAWIATRQALGRGARSPSDECLWVLADKRFAKGWFRKQLEALGIRFSIAKLSSIDVESKRSA